MGEKSKKLILAIGVLVLCIVWGRNLVLVGDAAQGVIQVDQAVTHETRTNTGGRPVNSEFEPPERDPFEIPHSKRAVTPKAASTVAAVPRPIPTVQASYRGIVWNNTRPQLIVFDSLSSSTKLLTMGDTLNRFILTSITRDAAVLKCGRHETVWKSEQTSQ